MTWLLALLWTLLLETESEPDDDTPSDEEEEEEEDDDEIKNPATDEEKIQNPGSRNRAMRPDAGGRSTEPPRTGSPS